MNLRLVPLIIILQALGFIKPVMAQGDIYVAGSDAGLYLLNPGSCSSRFIGYSLTFFDIAIHPKTGVLYGISSSTLYRIDTSDATASRIGSTVSGLNALEFSDDGILYAMGFSNTNLYSLDLSTAKATVLGNTNHKSAGDLIFHEGSLYLANSSKRLIEINIDNPSNTKDYGKINVPGSVLAIASYGCNDDIHLFSMNDLHSMNGINPAMAKTICQDILPAFVEAYGAASTRQGEQIFLENLGNDTFLCADSGLLLAVHKYRGVTYLWNTGSTDTSIIADSSGSYTLKREFGNCSQIDTINLILGEMPWFQLREDTAICQDDSILLKVPTIPYPVQWLGTSSSLDIYGRASNIYILQATNACGSWTDSLKIDSIYCGSVTLLMPNVFTPNQDGINDLFLPIEMLRVLDPVILIFNRWGEEVYRSIDLNQGWDGSFNGNPLPEATYFWIIDYQSAHGERYRLSGMVELIR